MKKQYKSLYPMQVEVNNQQIINYCGIRCAMEVLGGKWKLLIIASLFKEAMRFKDLKRAIPEISDKMLDSSLKELELHGLICRELYQENSHRGVYTLTTYGVAIRPLLETLYAWGEDHIKQYPELMLQ